MLSEIAEYLRQICGIHVSQSTILRTLHRRGFTRKKVMLISIHYLPPLQLIFTGDTTCNWTGRVRLRRVQDGCRRTLWILSPSFCGRKPHESAFIATKLCMVTSRRPCSETRLLCSWKTVCIFAFNWERCSDSLKILHSSCYLSQWCHPPWGDWPCFYWAWLRQFHPGCAWSNATMASPQLRACDGQRAYPQGPRHTGDDWRAVSYLSVHRIRTIRTRLFWSVSLPESPDISHWLLFSVECGYCFFQLTRPIWILLKKGSRASNHGCGWIVHLSSVNLKVETATHMRWFGRPCILCRKVVKCLFRPIRAFLTCRPDHAWAGR